MNGAMSNLMQIASLRRYEMTDGNARGLKVIECDNGKLRCLLNESKALDMMQLFHEGQNVSFVSKNGFTKREIPFAGRFEGGMLYTCGLDSVGDRDGFELHGRLHNTPALITQAVCNESGITVEAEISDTALFGKNLVLKRRFFTAIGSDTVEICDRLENRGCRSEDYCLLYHVNIGYPMLCEGAELIGNVLHATPRNAWSAAHAALREKMTAPAAQQEEMCYYLDLKEPQISLMNKKSGKQFTLYWSGDTLPRFIQWKSMACGDYALGLEPSTTELDGAFTYATVPAGACADFSIKMKIDKIV